MKENYVFALFALMGAVLMNTTYNAIGSTATLSIAIGYHVLFIIGLVFVLLSIGKLIYEIKTTKK